MDSILEILLLWHNKYFDKTFKKIFPEPLFNKKWNTIWMNQRRAFICYDIIKEYKPLNWKQRTILYTIQTTGETLLNYITEPLGDVIINTI